MRLKQFDMPVWDWLRDHGYKCAVVTSVPYKEEETSPFHLSFLITPFQSQWEAEYFLDTQKDPSQITALIMSLDELGKEIFWEGFGHQWAEYLVDTENVDWSLENRPAA